VPPGISALPSDTILAPGFIDIQVNGGGGVLLNDDPSEAAVRRIVQAHRRTGTTGCLPTLITDHTDVVEQLAAVAPGSLQIPGVLGFHLEGPALNKARKGIHLESEIRVPNARDLAEMMSFTDCGRSIVTLAPECVPPSLIDDLLEEGLRLSAGIATRRRRKLSRPRIAA
jgi:N-acetylglucosamine-6-phosphate deacetylase